MSKKDLVLGIDIGSHSLKVCQLKKNPHKYKIVALGRALLPKNAVLEGKLKQPAQIAETLSGLLSNLKIRNKKVGFSLSGDAVIIKKISLPAMSVSELEEYILTEAEQYIPYDIDSVYLDYHNLHTAKTDRTDVLLVAAPKELIDGYLRMFTTLKLTPVLADVDIFALENSYENSHPEKENVAIVDIGAAKIKINILVNGISSISRDAELGSTKLTTDLANALAIDFDTAEAIKVGKKKRTDNQQLIEKVFFSTCTEWILEIKDAIDIYRINHPRHPLKRLIIGGGGSKVDGFQELLSRETGLTVELFDPFANFDFDRKKFNPAYLESVGPEMAIATGVALRHSVI